MGLPKISKEGTQKQDPALFDFAFYSRFDKSAFPPELHFNTLPADNMSLAYGLVRKNRAR